MTGDVQWRLARAPGWASSPSGRLRAALLRKTDALTQRWASGLFAPLNYCESRLRAPGGSPVSNLRVSTRVWNCWAVWMRGKKAPSLLRVSTGRVSTAPFDRDFPRVSVRGGARDRPQGEAPRDGLRPPSRRPGVRPVPPAISPGPPLPTERENIQRRWAPRRNVRIVSTP